MIQPSDATEATCVERKYGQHAKPEEEVENVGHQKSPKLCQPRKMTNLTSNLDWEFWSPA